MRLSILIPTRRNSLTAVSRVAQVCSWAGPDVEVIVRDNSGEAEKRDLISRFQSDRCNIVLVDPCEALENFRETLRLAKGDFVFFPSDDDLCFDRAIAAMPSVLEQHGNEPSVMGVTGHYVVETALGSSIASYNDVDSDDPVARVAGYLSYRGPNVIFYSALRRDMVERIFNFLTMMPFYFSFHDQIQSLLFLLSGKFIKIDRLLYCYDVGVWQTKTSAEQRDLDYYRAAGLDPVINIIHWLLCAFEGAVLVRNSNVFPNYPLVQRQAMADRWFAARFGGFVHGGRSAYGSEFEEDAKRIRQRVLASTDQRSFQRLLGEICNVFALFSMDKATRYYEFWDAQINQTAVAGRPARPERAAPRTISGASGTADV